MIKDADFLGIEDIKEEGIKILAYHLNSQEVVKAYHLSDLCNSSLLKEHCQRYILQNFEDISRSDEFLKLDVNSVKDIFKSDLINFCSIKAYKGVLRWLVADLEKRKPHLNDVLELIRIDRIDFREFSRMTTNENILTKSTDHK